MPTSVLSRLQSGVMVGTSWFEGTPVNLGVPPGAIEELWAQWDFTETGVWALSAASIVLSVDPVFVGFSYGYELMLLDYPVTENFSDTNLPSQLPKTVITDFFPTQLLPPTPPYTVTLELHTTEGMATALLDALRAGPKTKDSEGVRRLALGLRHTTDSVGPTGGVDLTALSLTGVPEFTGLQGPYQAYGRADECPKCGYKSTRDTWVRDGYTDMMVCGRCYDEEDLVGRHYQGLGSERQGQGEG